MRRKLSTANEKDDFDLVIHGSPEHVGCLPKDRDYGPRDVDSIGTD